MFLRFSKGKYSDDKVRLFRKCVFLGDSLVMEYGNKIVGAAKLLEETETQQNYIVCVAQKCEIGAETISRFIKDMIGKSFKFSDTTAKRRRYHVEYIDSDELPITAKIVFSR